jgi:hypothetical protein
MTLTDLYLPLAPRQLAVSAPAKSNSPVTLPYCEKRYLWHSQGYLTKGIELVGLTHGSISCKGQAGYRRGVITAVSHGTVSKSPARANRTFCCARLRQELP